MAVRVIVALPDMAHDLSISDLFNSCLQHVSPYGLAVSFLGTKLSHDKVSGIDITDEISDKVYSDFLASKQLLTPERITEFCAANLISPDDLKRLALHSVRMDNYCLSHYKEAASSHFLSHKDDYDIVDYSLLRVKEQGLAAELYFRLSEGEDTFRNLASTYSCGPEKSTNGRVASSPLSRAHPQLARILRNLQPSTITQPFFLEDWWIIVRLESLTNASLDESLLLRICKKLFDNDIQAEVRLILSSLSNLSNA